MIIIKKRLILSLVLMLVFSSFSFADNSKVEAGNDFKLTGENRREELLSLRLKLYEERVEEIPVLLYHHIASEEDIETYGWENNTSIISAENFEEQMEYLRDNNYFTATLEELELFIDGEIELPENTVVITFDDGYLSNIDYAYPIMKDYGYRGTVFMVGATSTRDESNLEPEEFYHITPSEIHSYKDVFDFACHTYNMHSRDEEGTPLLLSNSREEIIEDLNKNLELFPTKYMAYPYGNRNTDTINLISELGYTMGFTVDRGFVSKDSNKFELPRNPVRPRINIERFSNLINVD